MRQWAAVMGCMWALAGCGLFHGGEATPTSVSDDGWVTYGDPLSSAAVIPAAKLLAEPAAFVDQTVVVEGRVADVCSKAGCWMVIAEGDRTMRIRMKDHAFSVAKDGTGSSCRIDGKVVAIDVDPATVKHFEEESRKPELMPEKSVKGAVVYEMVASGVAMQRSTTL